MSVRDLVGVGLAGGAAWLLWRQLATTLPAGSLQGPVSLPWPAGDPFGGFTLDFTGGGGTTSLAPVQYEGAPAADQAESSDSYTQATTARESSGDPLAKNPNSSASGLYQFTKATWQSLGGAWGPDPTKAFGGLTPSAEEQTARFNMLTSRNSSGLLGAGIAATDAALYAAHFLGLGAAIKVLTAPASASLANLVGSAVMNANPQLRGMTVADFKSWAGGQG